MNAAALLFATLSIFRMGGDIRVDDAPNGAALRTMGGDIRVVRGAGHILARTMGGNIEIEHLDGSAVATTMGGNVTVNVDSGRDVELFSMGGEIEVTLPRGFSGDFVVELEDGDNGEQHEIKSDFPLQITKADRWHFFGGTRRVLTGTGRSGSGANRVKISTIGGDITIRQK
jgi:DUF4097 and DUF4098 domain-containing protein YvlB